MRRKQASRLITKQHLIIRPAGDLKIIWFRGSNRYSLVEMPAWEVIHRLTEGMKSEAIVSEIADLYSIPKTEARRFVREIRAMVNAQSAPDVNEPGAIVIDVPEGVRPRNPSEKIYKLSGCMVSVAFEDDVSEHLIHPKFAHLEQPAGTPADHRIEIFGFAGRYVMRVNGTVIGQWLPQDLHYLAGRFTMELLNRMHGTVDSDWFGVFHASAISRGNRCILFLGDSGNGKSTACAILMANGFGLVADDCVPVESGSASARFLPAAVSVKKAALDHLIPIYPELESAAEFYYPGLDKTVRYLAPDISTGNTGEGFPCVALIFVKYEPNSGLIIENLPKEVAFRHLVPDSWLSPLPTNAEAFLDWFLNLPSYRLTYSDNAKMVEKVGELFEGTGG